MCPDPAALARVPAAELDALLERLVLGHQASPTSFEVLARVPLPAEMQLKCPTTATAGLHASLGQRLLNTLASFVLPARANAANRRRFTGGVGGSTSEFSPFGPVDPQLYATGGVGGSTSEFVRTGGASLMEPATIDGTVGTIRTGASLPAVTVKTYLGTPIPGIQVQFATVPAFGHTPAGNASVCGAESATDVHGSAALTCLNFGNTVQYKTAYTKLAANFYLPPAYAGFDAQGLPVVTITPVPQSWLVVTHGPSTLAITQPGAGRTVAAGNPFKADGTVPVRVEIRSDLGDVITSATNQVTLSLNQNAFAGGGTTVTANAVGGAATFTTQIPTAATGYQFSATAAIGELGTVSNNGTGNLFDVIAGAPAKISAVGPSAYSTINPSGNPLYPPPSVIVTDAGNNPVSGAKVFWTPSGAAGAQVEGSSTQASTTTGASGTTSVSWLLGQGSNQLRASLQAGPGGAEINFTGTLAPARNPSDPCEPGAVKDAFGNCYFVTPRTNGGTTLLRTITNLLSGRP